MITEGKSTSSKEKLKLGYQWVFLLRNAQNISFNISLSGIKYSEAASSNFSPTIINDFYCSKTLTVDLAPSFHLGNLFVLTV